MVPLPPFAWLLNPDAERELSAPGHYTSSVRLLRQSAERKRLFEGLTGAEPSYFAGDFPERSSAFESEATALCWCPTTNATSRASELGWRLPAVPPMDALRQVHDKLFLGEKLSTLTLPGHLHVKSDREWRHIRQTHRGTLKAKRRFAFAGKGQRRLPEVLSEDDERWVRDSLKEGFLVEPHLPSASVFSLHGLAAAEPLTGRLCSLEVDTFGAPAQIRALPSGTRAGESSEIAQALLSALLAAGYHGPWGADFLLHGDRLCLIDLNPRFTLGWSIGMGEQRRAALAQLLS